MASIDIKNQFPNSKMAQAVRAGASQMRSVDAATDLMSGEQNNVSIASASTLTIPGANTDGGPATYAIVCAIGGPAYYTYDGSTPSPANFAGALGAGQMLPVNGFEAMSAFKIIGTTMSVTYWR